MLFGICDRPANKNTVRSQMWTTEDDWNRQPIKTKGTCLVMIKVRFPGEKSLLVSMCSSRFIQQWRFSRMSVCMCKTKHCSSSASGQYSLMKPSMAQSDSNILNFSNLQLSKCYSLWEIRGTEMSSYLSKTISFSASFAKAER